MSDLSTKYQSKDRDEVDEKVKPDVRSDRKNDRMILMEKSVNSLSSTTTACFIMMMMVMVVIIATYVAMIYAYMKFYSPWCNQLKDDISMSVFKDVMNALEAQNADAFNKLNATPK